MAPSMKVPIGFLLGFVAGAYVWSKLTEDQRAGIAERVDHFATTGRTGKIAASVRRGAGSVADVATERVTDATETFTGAAASKLSADDTSSIATGSTSTP